MDSVDVLCVEFVDYSVLVNRDDVGPIILGRGLRQGEPLSPIYLLFVWKACHLLSVMWRKNALLLEPGCAEGRPQFLISVSPTTVSSSFVGKKTKLIS